MQLSSTNPSTRSLCLSVCCAALCFTSQVTFADLTNDVATIADVMEAFGSGVIGFYTYPRSPGGYNLSRYIWAGLFDGSGTDGAPVQSRSILRQIRDRIPTNDVVVSVTNVVSFDDSGLLSTLDDIYTAAHNLDLDVSWMLSALTYSSSMWHAHLDDAQLDELLDSLDDINGTMESGFGTMESGFDALSTAMATGFSSVDLTPVTSRQDAQYDRETYANTYGQSAANSLSSDVAMAEAQDAETISTLDHDTLQAYETEPTMPDYTPSDGHDAADPNKDSLLDSLGNDALYHSPVLTLVSASDFKAVTGTEGSMVYNLAEGPVYTFIGDLGTICSAAWYGLLAVFSALLFWRKQNEISGIVRATNFSRV